MNNSLQPDEQYIRVFVAKYPFDVLNNFIPLPRRKEIDGCKDVEVAQSKYYVFKLLEIALREVYGVAMSECSLKRDAHGKWTCDVCELSLSHSGNVVAVAVSDRSVGVDVQIVDTVRFNDRMQMRIFTEDERAFAGKMTADERALYANRAWTVKEAVFKSGGGQRFIPSGINTIAADYSTVTAVAGDKSFFVTTVGMRRSQVQYSAINVQISGK